MTTYTLTPKQMLAIYEAGIERGNDEATSWEWGSRPAHDELREMENCLVWENKCGLMEGVDYDEKEPWWQAFKAELKD